MRASGLKWWFAAIADACYIESGLSDVVTGESGRSPFAPRGAGGGKSGLRRAGCPGVVPGGFPFKRERRKVPQKTYRLFFLVEEGLPSEALAKEGKGEKVV